MIAGKVVEQLWAGALLEDASWEDAAAIKKMLPSLHLEDKVSLGEEGHDTIQVKDSIIEEDLRKYMENQEEEDENEEEKASTDEEKSKVSSEVSSEEETM